MKLKVLFTASTFSHICHFHLPYLRAFREKGWVVHVACGGTPIDIDDADEVFYVPFQKKMSSSKNFQAAATLRSKISAEGYDLVCTHTSLASFFTRLALWGMKERPKVVNMVHGYLFDDKTAFGKRSILLLAELITAPQTDLLLTMNHWDFETAKRYKLGKRVSMIPGIGVDFSKFDVAKQQDPSSLRDFLGIRKDAFVLMYAAEFSKRKNQETIIRALTKLPDHVILILAGDGIMKKDCEILVEKLGLCNRVLFPGYIKDIPNWYCISDVVISASRSEGLPFNIMEALYLRKPIVASNVKGHTDLSAVSQLITLFRYGDSSACFDAILKLLESENTEFTKDDSYPPKMDRYSLTHVLPIVMREYESVLTEF